MMRKSVALSAFFLATFCTVIAFAADDASEQAAIVTAVERVTPCVVRIETIGGLERIGEMSLGTGPTTGLIVDPSGYIMTSAFNFINKPTSILVRLADGSRYPARLVATDHSRMLVLLKIETNQPLPTPESVPVAAMRVGQWAIAVGRTFDAERPNMAVGILSALNRVWGKAIQTDAAVSPNNYGGPLIDIHGRVLGVLVPLSPDGTDEMAGVEWYDSGIGFAIPLVDFQKTLPRLIEGHDLHPGLMGFSLKGPNQYTSEPVIVACRPKSPAIESGLRPGDRIVEIDGQPVRRSADVRQELGRHYAGDVMKFTIERDGARSDHEATLATSIEPFQHGFLGILPMRSDLNEGVPVRYIYPNSPAATAGINTDDTIVSLQGEPVTDRHELQLKIGAFEPGKQVDLGVRRDGVVRMVSAILAAEPQSLPPANLPSSRVQNHTAIKQPPNAGALQLKIPEYPHETWAYVPEHDPTTVSYGIVVWLHGAGGLDWPKTLATWKPLCDRYDLILIAPKAKESARWSPTEASLIDRLLNKVMASYHIDPARIVLHGYEGGGSLAYLVAARNRDSIRAVGTVESMPTGQPPENDPLERLSMYIAVANKSRLAKPIAEWVGACEKQKIPTLRKDLGETPRYFNAEELVEFVRWIDTLDRI